MFKRGDVILAPCRGDRGEELRPHWMVVLDVDEDTREVLAVFTTSIKEGMSGGLFAFTDEERSAAGFVEPSRFDPNSVWSYAKDVHHLISQPGSTRRLPKRMLNRIRLAVMKRHPQVRRYRLCD